MCIGIKYFLSLGCLLMRIGLATFLWQAALSTRINEQGSNNNKIKYLCRSPHCERKSAFSYIIVAGTYIKTNIKYNM